MHLSAKKSLGQHWLKSRKVRDLIVKTAQLQAGERVLEIGPGQGFLTEALLATGAKVVAIEKDDRLIAHLQDKFASFIRSGQLILIHEDILNISNPYSLTPSPYRLVANIPYYVTGEILRLFLSSDHQPQSLTVLVQKEVAERIVAKDGKESLLSMSVKIYGTPRYVATVAAKYFSPPPQVASAILHISNISKARLAGTGEEQFFQTLRAGFAHKRKMLKNNLAHLVGLSSSPEIFSQCKIEDKARAEELSLEQWLCLTATITTSKDS